MERHTLSYTHKDTALLESICPVYEQSFPPDERREFGDVLCIAEEEPAFYTDIYTENGETLGFITYWQFEEFVYVEHFAVHEKTRGKGYGKVILGNLLTRSSLPFVLEVEPPVDVTAERRIRFYERMGFTVCDIPYLQPPYSEGKKPVSLLLMSYGNINLQESFREIERILHQKVYKHVL